MIENYFIGKICTIITVPININNLGAAERASIFTGTVEEINQNGILINGLQGLKSFFYKHQVVGVLEERVVKNKQADDTIKQSVSMDLLSSMIKKN